MIVNRQQDRSILWALDLLLSGTLELSEVCWALDEIRSSLSPAGRWVKEDLLHSWRDTGFLLMDFATYRELRWLQAARWLIVNQEKRFDPLLLRSIKVPAPIPFEEFDLISTLLSNGIPVESHVPIHKRLVFLANVLLILEFEVSQGTADCATKILVGEESLDVVELDVQGMLIKLNENWDDAEHPLVAARARYKVLQRIMSLPYHGQNATDTDID
ncbi:MAG: hypothetical protein KIT74_05815 [Fimbriimonadales bacterium]|nr:hypothetical protein [Fimbriimonadales bacterium]